MRDSHNTDVNKTFDQLINEQKEISKLREDAKRDRTRNIIPTALMGGLFLMYVCGSVLHVCKVTH